MTTETWLHLAITAGGWIAMVATMRQQISGQNERLIKLEKCEEASSITFVPRREIEALLAGIKQQVEQTNRILAVALRRIRRQNAGS